MQKNTIIFIVMSCLAMTFRCLVAQTGHNYDMDSWWIIAELSEEGKLPYGETFRYNYGMLWACILGLLRQLQLLFGGDGVANFHLWVTGFLSLVDIGIAYWLWKRFGKLFFAGLFLFNPVSIFLTGYHTQFENLAILWGLLSWGAWQDGKTRLAGVLLGFSLVQKHLFIFLPIWLFFDKNKPLKARLELPIIAYVVFAISFLGFAFDAAAWDGVKQNVLAYNSAEGIAVIPLCLRQIMTDGQWHSYLGWIPVFSDYKFFFALGMLGAGYFFMRRVPQQGIYLYTLCMLAFTSAMVNQYWAIPIIAMVYYHRNWEMMLLILFVTLFLVFRSPTGWGNWATIQEIYAWGGYEEIKRALLSHYSLQLIVFFFLFQKILTLQLGSGSND